MVPEHRGEIAFWHGPVSPRSKRLTIGPATPTRTSCATYTSLTSRIVIKIREVPAFGVGLEGETGSAMSIKLVRAFKVTEEQHADAFERFANSFLVDDYSELKALGGKKDKGMDAYLYDDKAGKAVIVVQSCVSPVSRARTKVLATIKKLKENNLLPEVFIYCTSDNVGTELDETKKELRQDYKITLDVCDAAWFVARTRRPRTVPRAATPMPARRLSRSSATSSRTSFTALSWGRPNNGSRSNTSKR